jgi:hypothetical protein
MGVRGQGGCTAVVKNQGTAVVAQRTEEQTDCQRKKKGGGVPRTCLLNTKTLRA